jgi:hypothetical protein
VKHITARAFFSPGGVGVEAEPVILVRRLGLDIETVRLTAGGYEATRPVIPMLAIPHGGIDVRAYLG